MRRVIPFKRKENVDELLSQVLAVPRSGGLEPDPAIRHAVVAQMSARERSGFNIWRALSDVFPVRWPVYQMAFAMGIVLFAVLGIRQSQPDPTTTGSPESPVAVMDTSRTDSPRVSLSDTLSQRGMINIFSASSPVDSL
ncbi:MAG: hypothetical protein OXH16_17895 [Gemmatimonadetes bacterium]|nr:hypothetical protein [Gemmatimonadota bacterium]